MVKRDRFSENPIKTYRQEVYSMFLTRMARAAVHLAPRCLSFVLAFGLLTGVASAQQIIGPPDDPYEIQGDIPKEIPVIPDGMKAALTGADTLRITQLDPSLFPGICSYVMVTDPHGDPLGGLNSDSFCVWQDANRITSFTVRQTHLDSCITSICLVIDVSGSMGDGHKIDSAKSAANQFVDQMDIYDRVAIVKFSSCYEVVQSFTSDKTLLHTKINALSAGGNTAAFDGIWAGTGLTTTELGSKAVIALTDGMENNSQNCGPAGSPDGLSDHSFADDSTLIVGLAVGAGVPIYTISLGSQFDPQYLLKLSAGSGGDYYHAPTGAQISALYSEIKFRLCSRYVICYTSPDTVRNGGCHLVKICRHEVTGACTHCDTARYCEPYPPVIQITVDPTCRPWEKDLKICATVTDQDTPPASLDVKLFYRMSSGSYTSVTMSRSSSTFCYTIPGNLIPCGLDSVQFYITASDGQSTVASPANAPLGHHAIAICPNHPPVCNLPNDVTVFLCDGDTSVCFPYTPAYDPDGNLVRCDVHLLSGPKEATCTDSVCFHAPILAGTYVVEQICVDACGASCSDTFRVTFAIDAAPTIAFGSDQTLMQCAPERICAPYTVSDPNGLAGLIETLVSGPAGATIDTAANKVCFTPSGAGDYRIIAKVKDPCKLTDLDTIVYHITINAPPTIAFGKDTTLFQCDPAPICLAYTVSDPNGLARLVETLVSGPAGAAIDTAGNKVCFTPSGSGTFTIIAKVADSCGATDYDTVVARVTVNQPPVCEFRTPSPPQCSPPIFVVPFTCTDPEGQPTNCVLYGPGSLSGNVYQYIPIGGETINVIIRCYDECRDSCEISFEVTFPSKQPPVCIVPNDTTIFQCLPAEVCLPVTATSIHPPTVCDVISGPGQIVDGKWCYKPAGNETAVVTVRCLDYCEDSCIDSFSVTFVMNEAPVCIVPKDTTIFQCVPTQVCLPVSATDADGNLVGCTITGGPGNLVGGQWCYTPAGDEQVTVTVRCTDECKAYCEKSFVVTFKINRPPVCHLPKDTTFFLCDGDTTICLPYRTPHDPDGNLVRCTAHLLSGPKGGKCTEDICFTAPIEEGTYVVELTCVDACGATCTDTLTVTFNINEPPVCHMPGDTTIFLCGPDTVCIPFSATDADGNFYQCVLDLKGGGPGFIRNYELCFNNPSAGTYSVPLACYDSCRAVCRDTITVTFIMNQPPVCNLPNDTTFFLCDGDTTVCFPDHKPYDPDGNLVRCTLRLLSGPKGGKYIEELCFGPIEEGTYVVELTCIDACGATCADTFTVTFNINEAPVCTVPRDTVIFQCVPTQVCLPVSATDADGNLIGCTITLGPGQLVDGKWCYTPTGDEVVDVSVLCTDSCGAYCFKLFHVAFKINEPPVCHMPGDTTIFLCGPDTVCIPFSATDADGNFDQCVLDTKGGGPGFIRDYRLCFLNPPPGTYHVPIACYDSCGAVCRDTITATFIMNAPPECHVPNDTTILLCKVEEVCLPVFGTDPDGNLDYCRMVNGPGTLVNGKWCYTPTADQAVTVTIGCVDSCGAICEKAFTVKFDINEPPVCTVPNDTTIFLCEPKRICLPFSSEDADGNFWYCQIVTGACDECKDPNACKTGGQGQWCCYADHDTTIVVTIRCYDFCGVYCEKTFTVTFRLNRPPVCDLPKDTTLFLCDADTTVCFFARSPYDPDGNIDSCTLRLLNRPKSAKTDGFRICFTPPIEEGTYVIEETCVDSCGAVCADTFTVTFNINDPPVITCPPNLTFECDKIGDFGQPTVTDDQPNPQVSVTRDSVGSPGCPQAYRLTLTYVATDVCGAADTCKQIITVVDTTPPQIVCPRDTTIECDEIGGEGAKALLSLKPPAGDDPFKGGGYDYRFGRPKVTDNCDPDPFYALVNVYLIDHNPCHTVIRLVFLSADHCRNISDSCYQHVIIVDSTPPEITCPRDTTIECSTWDAAKTIESIKTVKSCKSGDPGTAPCGWPTARDNCDPEPVICLCKMRVNTNNPCDVIIQLGFIATDWCQNVSDTCWQTIHVVDTTPPVVSCPRDTTIECDELPDIKIGGPPPFGWPTAIDNCDPKPVIKLVAVQHGGEFPCKAYVRLGFHAYDRCHNFSDTCWQTIYIVDTTPPVITCPRDTIVECDEVDGTRPHKGDPQSPYGWPTATDNCDREPRIELVSVQAGGVGCRVFYHYGFQAFDACGNKSDTCFQTVTVVDTTPPEIVCPDPLTYECDEVPQTFPPPKATDNCDESPVVKEIGRASSTTQECPQGYHLTIMWEAKDNCGLADTCTQVVNVVDTTPPVITCPRDTIVECDEVDGTAPQKGDPQSPYGWPTATDNCDLKPRIELVSVQAGGLGCRVFYHYGFQAFDACGNKSDTCFQTVIVVDTTPPEITCPRDTTISCDETDGDAAKALTSLRPPTGSDPFKTPPPYDYRFGRPTVKDNCDPNPVYALVNAYALEIGPCRSVIRLVFQSADHCPNISDSCYQSIIVVDTTRPEIFCPEPLTYECDEVPQTFPPPRATDNCDESPEVKEIGRASSTTQECPQGYHLTIMWEAKDNCGLADTCTQVVNVIDTTPPQITCPPDTTFYCGDLEALNKVESIKPQDPRTALQKGGSCIFGTPIVKDNCDPEPLRALVNAYPIQTDTCPVIWRLVYISADHCGNYSDSCYQNVFFDDTTRPICHVPNDTAIFICDPKLPVCLPVWGENDCGEPVCRIASGPGQLVDKQWCYTPTAPGTVSVTIACTDRCGNECRSTFRVTFRFNNPPFIELPPDFTVFLCEPDTICFGPIPEFDLDHNGAYDQINFGWVNERIDRACFEADTAGVYTIIVCLVDSCGAMACDTVHITVKFNRPPVCEVPNDTTIFLCEPREVCLPAGATDPDNNLASCGLMGKSPGTYDKGQWCYTPQGNETVDVAFACVDSCGAKCEKTFHVTFMLNRPPVCQVPNDTTIFLCEPKEICLPYGATDADGNLKECHVIGSDKRTVGYQWCFYAERDTAMSVTIHCEDSCGAYCEKTFRVTIDVSEPPVCPPVNDTTIALCSPVDVCIPVGVLGSTPSTKTAPSSDVRRSSDGKRPTRIGNGSTAASAYNPPTQSVAGVAFTCRIIAGPGYLGDGYWCYTPPDHDTAVTVTIQCVNECKQTCEETFTVTFNMNEPPVCKFKELAPPICTPAIDFVAFTSTDPEGGPTNCTLYGPGELVSGGWQYQDPVPGSHISVTVVCKDTCNDSCTIAFERSYPERQPTECHLPNDTTIFLCALKTDSLPVSGGSEGAECRIINGPGMLRNRHWIYTPTGEQTVNVTVRCVSLCDSCEGSFAVTYELNEPPECKVPRDTTIFLCTPAEVCLPYGATDADGNLAFCRIAGNDTKPTEKTEWCFYADRDTTLSVTIRCEDECQTYCEKTFHVTFVLNDAPICNLPRDTTIFQCTPTQVCLPASATDPNGNFRACQITSGPGQISGGNWCYTPTGDQTVNVTIRCSDSCDAYCEKTFRVTFDINDGPVCNVPRDTTIFQCTPAQVCLPVSATDVNNNLSGCRIYTGPGQLISGNWCYTPSGDQTVTVTIRCTDACNAFCEKTFRVTFNINDAPICQLGAYTQPACTTSVMFVPITATDPEQGPVTCQLISGPGQMVPGGWQYTPVPGQAFSVTIRCQDACGATCQSQFEVAVPQCAPPICNLPPDTAIRQCTPTQVCLPVSATSQNPPVTCVVTKGKGQVTGGNWCYTPAGTETDTVTIRCTDGIGNFCENSFVARFHVNTAPTCTIWPHDTTVVLCQNPSQICMPVAATDVDGNFRECTVTKGPGAIVGGNWCYAPPNENEVDVTIHCADSCGAYCEKTFHLQPLYNDPPFFRHVPEETTLVACGSQQVCVPIPVGDNDNNVTSCVVTSGPGQITGGSWCYTATGSGTFTVKMLCTDACGATAQRTMKVNIQYASSPVCNLHADTSYILCQAGTICLPIWGTGPEPVGVTCQILTGPGYISGNYWCYYASANATVTVGIRCTNPCGEQCTGSERTYRIRIDAHDCQGGTAGINFTPGPQVASVLPGDVDRSGVVDLVDLAKLMQYLRSQSSGVKTGASRVGAASAPDRGTFDIQAADANCDGAVDNRDADALSNYLFNNGKRPCSDKSSNGTGTTKSPTRVGGSGGGN